MIAEALAGRRLLVTGSTGFLGTALVERFLRAVPGCELVLLVRAGRRTRFRFRVTARGRPVRGAKVRFLGRTKRTGRRGRARMTRRPARRGVRRVVATKRGFRSAKVRVRVLRRR